MEPNEVNECRAIEPADITDAAIVPRVVYATEAMRNKGTRRTPRKRGLLRRAEERARGTGLKTALSYFEG